MPQPRRHHIVPKSYLLRFANDEERVKTIGRDDPSKSFVTAVTNVSVERDFYAIETHEGWDQSVEEELSKLEGWMATAIDRVLGGAFPPSHEDREAIAGFVALQWLRGRDIRSAFEMSQAKLEKAVLMNLPREEIRRRLRETEGREPEDDEVETMVELFSNPENYECQPHQNSSIRQIFEMLEGVTRLAYIRTWQLCRAREGAFVTSDAPVTLWSDPATRHPLFGTGFGSANEIAVPLDRHHALVLFHQGKLNEATRGLPARGVRALNWKTAVNGYRWVIHHPNDDPLEGMEMPPSQPKLAFAGTGRRIVRDDPETGA